MSTNRTSTATPPGGGNGGTANHNLTLDWLRGVAAIAVVAFHFSRRLELPLLFGHGYLAVDFFFVLSGFVIAKAYTERLAEDRLTGWSFFVTRAIRLLPMVMAGTVLAALVEIGRPGIGDHALHLREGLTAMVLGSVLIPVMWTTTLEHTVFPLNAPMWTLFLEAISNLLFVPWARLRLGRGWLYAAMALSAPFLVYGALDTGASEFGQVPETFFLGFARIGWSFPIGILLYHWRDKAPRTGAATVTIALVALLAVPHLAALNALYDLVAVLLVLPLIVLAASNSTIDRRWAAWSGNLSYPLYAMHYPLVRLLGVIGLKLHLSAWGRLGFALAGLAGLVVIGTAAFHFYDQPVRSWLTARRRARSATVG
jgi:peptidoglycan/LPS O-acetylase OafA/YrhL